MPIASWIQFRLIPALLATLWLAPSAAVAEEASNRLLDTAWDAEMLSAAIAAERRDVPAGLRVTGVGVPHHLIAPDLIARGLLAAAGTDFDTILLLSPDHFRATETPFGVTSRPLETVFGPLPPALEFTEAFRGAPGLATDIGAAPREHGLHAVTPFISALYPGTRVVGVTVAPKSAPEDWERAISLLVGLVDDRTLVVQSTDYSHFLPVRLSVHRDQETLAALAAGTEAAILDLQQPAHLDSLGAQYMQTALQRRRFGAAPMVVGNRNSLTGPGSGDTATTSYIVTVYAADPARMGHLRYPDHQVAYLAGDTFLGRGMEPLLDDPAARAALVAAAQDVTAGAPLILNLEGTILDAVPAGRTNAQHLMLAHSVLPMLTELGTRAASLANNHAADFGSVGMAQTKAHLSRAGIAALEHGQIADLGAFRVLPLTFRRSYFAEHPAIRDPDQIAAICAQPAEPPLLAFLHWGGDYENPFGDFERAVISALERCGVSAVVGSHSHVASRGVLPLEGGAVPTVLSLGNFLFDQDHPGIGGAMAEIRVFAQGTVALRLIPLGNLYAGTARR